VTRYSFPGSLFPTDALRSALVWTQGSILVAQVQFGSCTTCRHLSGHIRISTGMGLAVTYFFKTTFITSPATKFKLTLSGLYFITQHIIHDLSTQTLSKRAYCMSMCLSFPEIVVMRNFYEIRTPRLLYFISNISYCHILFRLIIFLLHGCQPSAQ